MNEIEQRLAEIRERVERIQHHGTAGDNTEQAYVDDASFLLDQLDAFRAAALGIQRGTYIAGIETPCASVAWDRWKALVGLIDERLSIEPPDPAPEYLDAVAALQRHCAMQEERLERMGERLREARVETERLTAELAALKAQEP